MSASAVGDRWSFGPLRLLHERAVRGPRTTRLARALAELAGPAASVLDVGAGDGILGRAVADLVGARRHEAVDLAPPRSSRARAADGAALPFPDASFEVVLLADVLHHARHPARVLDEALRCAARAVIVKDHLARGLLDHLRLYAMDVVGNPSRDVEIPGGYFTPSSFGGLVRTAGATLTRVAWPLHVHDAQVRVLAPSEIQIAASLLPPRRGGLP